MPAGHPVCVAQRHRLATTARRAGVRLGPAGGASSAGSGPESWPRRRPEALLGDKGYDSNPNRDELRKRRILPVISRKGSPNINGLGTLRYVVEQTFALLHQFERLAVRWERRTDSTMPLSPPLAASFDGDASRRPATIAPRALGTGIDEG